MSKQKIIEALTEQEEKILKEKYIPKWNKVALDTSPLDKEKVIQLMKEYLESENHPGGLPEHVFFARSPKELKRMAGFCEYLHKQGTLDEELKKGINFQELFKDEKNTKLADQHISNEIRNNIYYGNHDSSWVGYYDFVRNELKYTSGKLKGQLKFVEETDCIQSYTKLMPHVHSFLISNKAIFISEKPTQMHLNERWNFHNMNGPALLYSDGAALFEVNGVTVPRFVIEEPEKITVTIIEKERNVEVRRVMIEKYGRQRYMEDSGAQLLDKSEWGELYRKERPNDTPILMVFVDNSTPEPDGTIKKYALTVHHECRPIIFTGRKDENGNDQYDLGEPQKLTALNAIASTFGETGEEYAKIEMMS